jgi:hypothetical protein
MSRQSITAIESKDSRCSLRALHETSGDQLGRMKGLWSSDVTVGDIRLPAYTQFSSTACSSQSDRV